MARYFAKNNRGTSLIQPWSYGISVRFQGWK